MFSKLLKITKIICLGSALFLPVAGAAKGLLPVDQKDDREQKPAFYFDGDIAKVLFQELAVLENTFSMQQIYVREGLITLKRLVNYEIGIRCDYAIPFLRGGFVGSVKTRFFCEPALFQACEKTISYRELSDGEYLDWSWSHCRAPDKGSITVGVGTLRIEPTWPYDEEEGFDFGRDGVEFPDTVDVDFTYIPPTDFPVPVW